MSVLIFLPERLRAHVRHVLVKEREILIANSWDELDTIIREKPVTALVLDPAADGVININAVLGILNISIASCRRSVS